MKRLCVCVCECVRVCMWVCMCVYVCVSMNLNELHQDKQTFLTSTNGLVITVTLEVHNTEDLG